MAVKTDTEVIIGGKVLTLSGYESEEYLQKVASYINNKLAEYGRVESFRRQPVDTQHVLLELNIADDYFKAKKQIDRMDEEAASREKELYDLKPVSYTHLRRVYSPDPKAAPETPPSVQAQGCLSGTGRRRGRPAHGRWKGHNR